MSPVVKVNVYGNYLIVALRDGHITIYHLTRALLPTGGWEEVVAEFLLVGGGGGARGALKKDLPPLSQTDLPHIQPHVFSCCPPVKFSEINPD